MILVGQQGRIFEGGRVVVPAPYREAMGLAQGDAVVIELHGGELRIRPHGPRYGACRTG